MKIEKVDKKIVAFTDGGCAPANPGPGAYGIILPIEGTEEVLTLSKGYHLTTNNRMEMMALIVLLKEFGPNKTFEVHIDSNYCLQGVKFWMKAWHRKGWKNTDWKTGAEKPIKNLDLWQELYGLCLENSVTFIKVKSHTGVKYNEMADQACTETMKNPTEIDEGYVNKMA